MKLNRITRRPKEEKEKNIKKMNNLMHKIKTTRILAIIGLSCSIVGIFLPYLKFSVSTVRRSIAMWKYFEGKVMLLLVIYNAVLIFKDYIEKIIPKLEKNEVWKVITKFNSPIFSLVPTGLYAFLTLYSMKTYSFNVTSTTVKYTLGCFVLWIGVICLVGYSILFKKNKKEAVLSNVNLGTGATVNGSTATTQEGSNTIKPAPIEGDAYIGDGIILGFAASSQPTQNKTETIKTTPVTTDATVQPVTQENIQSVSTEPTNVVPEANNNLLNPQVNIEQVNPTNIDRPTNYQTVNTSNNVTPTTYNVQPENIQNNQPLGSTPAMIIEPGKDMSRPDMIQLVPNGYGANKGGETVNPFSVPLDSPPKAEPVQSTQNQFVPPKYNNEYNIPFYVPETENQMIQNIEQVQPVENAPLYQYENSNSNMQNARGQEPLNNSFFQNNQTQIQNTFTEPAYTISNNQNMMNRLDNSGTNNLNTTVSNTVEPNNLQNPSGFFQNNVNNNTQNLNAIPQNSSMNSNFGGVQNTMQPPIYNAQPMNQPDNSGISNTNTTVPNTLEPNNLQNPSGFFQNDVNNSPQNLNAMPQNSSMNSNFGGEQNTVQPPIYNAQPMNQPSNTQNVTQPQNNIQEPYHQVTIQCPNCGAIYDAILKQCPNCGRESN